MSKSLMTKRRNPFSKKVGRMSKNKVKMKIKIKKATKIKLVVLNAHF